MSHKVLQYGGYGCVFTPEFECTGSPSEGFEERYTAAKSRGTPLVSKLVPLQEEAVHEYEMSQIIAKADPRHKFSLGPLGFCTTTKPKKDQIICGETRDGREGLSDKFRNMIDRGEPIPQLITRNGGSDLRMLIQKKALSLRQLLFAFLPIVKGLVFFKMNNLVHLDIKLENILVDSTITGRLIDFNLSRPMRDVYFSLANPGPERGSDRLRTEYPTYPPEFDYVYSKINGAPLIPKNAKAASKLVPTFVALYHPDFRDQLLRMVSSINALVKDDYTPDLLLAMMSTVAGDRVDIYGLGITLMQAMHYTPQQDADAHLLQMAIKWAKNATFMNPFERFTPEEAFSAYIRILGSAVQGGASSSSAAAAAEPSPSSKKRKSSKGSR